MHEAIPSAPARRHFLPFKRCTSRGFSSLSRVTWCWRVGGSHALSPAWRETCKNVIPAKDGLCRKISVPSVYRIKEVVAPVSWTLKVSRGWIPRSWMSEVAVSSCLTSRWRDRADAGPFCVLGRDPLVLKFALVSFPVLDEVRCSFFFFWELEFSHFPSSYFPRLVRLKVVQQCGCHERRPRPASVACGGPSRLRPRLSIQFWRVDFFLKMTNSIYVFQLRLRCLQNSRDFVNLCFMCRHLVTPAGIYFCFLFFPDHLGRLLALLDFSHNLLRGLCALRCCSCR